MNRRQVLLGGTAALGLGGIGVWRWPRRDDSAQAALQQLFQRPLVRPDGQALPWSQFQGRPLLINFWATWCPPCVREMPELDQFAQSQGAQGWQVLGMALDQPEAVRRFLADTPVRFAVAVAPLDTLSLVQALGNTGGGLPFSLAVGADARIRHRKLGATTREELQAWAAAAA